MENSIQMQRIEKATTALVFDNPFFATLVMQLDVKETMEVPTFATDGKRLYVNPEWCAELSNQEVITVLAHEVMHCALGHMWRMPSGGNPIVWNMAVDNEVNWELEEFNQVCQNQGRSKPFPFPKCGAVMEDRFRGQAAEKVYRTLMEEHQDEKKQKGKNGKGEGQGMGDIIPAPDDKKSEMKEKWDRAVIQAASVSKGRGNIPGSIEELIKKLTSNEVDWRTLLRNFVSTVAHEDWSHSVPNRRYMDNDFMLPSLHNEKVGKLIFAIDTSGSITGEMLSAFLAEAQCALDEVLPESLEVIYCDTQIGAIDIYEPGDMVKERVVGRGGTDFRPVFEYCDKMEDLPKMVVYMTDLYGEFPTKAPEYPVVWLVNNKQQAPFGEMIEVKC